MVLVLWFMVIALIVWLPHAYYFDCEGQHYLVVRDRLSGWCDDFQTPYGSPQAESEGLATCLQSLFSCFGVSLDISNDGGLQFVSNNTETIRQSEHRLLSSCYDDQDHNLLLAQIVFGSSVRVAFTFPSRIDKFVHQNIQHLWRNVWVKRE